MNKNGLSLADIKYAATSQTLFTPTTLDDAIARLGFVQADPIRSPARAQDLILRQRVKGYKVGDLEEKYPFLGLDEDFLYAYGFVTKDVKRLLYPRPQKGSAFARQKKLTSFDEEVLAAVKQIGEVHPKDLERHFGTNKVVNAWGGYSKATKKSLEVLHEHGRLRVSRRQKGIRVYAVEQDDFLQNPLSLKERKQKIILQLLTLLAPVTEKTLTQALNYIRYFLGETRSALGELLSAGQVQKVKVDGVSYILPATFEKSPLPGGIGGKPFAQPKSFRVPATQNPSPRELALGVESRSPDGQGPSLPNASLHSGVKILAPFDPVVWDRARFEHLWGWQYRFEAYTPPTKRVRGYYAMPLLYNEDVIGWANLSVSQGRLEVDLGFLTSRPKSRDFRSGLDDELAKFESFLLS